MRSFLAKEPRLPLLFWARRLRGRLSRLVEPAVDEGPDQGAGRDTASEALAAQARVNTFFEAHRQRLSQGSHLRPQPYTSYPPPATDRSGAVRHPDGDGPHLRGNEQDDQEGPARLPPAARRAGLASSQRTGRPPLYVGRPVGRPISAPVNLRGLGRTPRLRAPSTTSTRTIHSKTRPLRPRGSHHLRRSRLRLSATKKASSEPPERLHKGEDYSAHSGPPEGDTLAAPTCRHSPGIGRP